MNNPFVRIPLFARCLFLVAIGLILVLIQIPEPYQTRLIVITTLSGLYMFLWALFIFLKNVYDLNKTIDQLFKYKP